MTPNDWNAAEALFAFCGWLTCRDERTVMSATDDASPAAERITEFCKRHGLAEPRDGWQHAIIPPMKES